MSSSSPKKPIKSSKRPIPKIKSLVSVNNDSDDSSKRKVRSEKFNTSLSSNGSLDDSGIDPFTLVGYKNSPPTRPCGRDTKAGWYDIHKRHVDLASRSNSSVILCGDSIIAGLSRYNSVWNKHFKPWNALNFGIGGDQTQHVLWRMENMTLPQTVEHAVLHCGTNNIDRDSPQEIAEGIISCGLVLQENNAELNVIVTGLLPRDLEDTSRRFKIRQTNKFIKHYCKQLMKFTYMRQDDDWVHEDGYLNEELYYSDHLHLIERGNVKFALSIIKMLVKVSNKEEIVYSDDQDNNIKISKFEKRLGERRTDDVIYESPYKLIRSDTGIHKRKRISPIDKLELKELKRRRTHSPTGSLCSKQNDSSLITPTTVKSNFRKNSSVSDQKKKGTADNHGGFNLSKELKHDKQHQEFLGNTEPLGSTAKSIDISLTDADRRAARMAKFGLASLVTDNSLKELSDLSKRSVRKNF